MIIILRAKRKDLLQTRKLDEAQEQNSALNISEMEEGKTILESYPRRIVLELTNACNLRCIMCGRSATEFTITHFDLANLQKLRPALHFAEEVTLFGWGEPTVHPRFVDILRYLDKFNVRKYFVTNGMLLDKIKDALFENHVDIIAISVDGAKAKTNDSIRRGSDLNKIKESIKAIVKEKNDRGLHYPYMNFVFTIMNSNLSEIPDMVRLTKEAGIEEVKFVYLTVFDKGLMKESVFDRQKDIMPLFEEAERLADEIGIKIKLPHIQGKDEAGNKKHKDCYTGWRDFFVGSDGNVRSCQSTSRKLFNIAKYDSFMEMWNSPELQRFRNSVNDEKNMPKECVNCYQSSHANWNRKEAFIQLDLQFAPEWEKND